MNFYSTYVTIANKLLVPLQKRLKRPMTVDLYADSSDSLDNWIGREMG